MSGIIEAAHLVLPQGVTLFLNQDTKLQWIHPSMSNTHFKIRIVERLKKLGHLDGLPINHMANTDTNLLLQLI